MEYFAGLDVSMEETHVCVVDREGGIVTGDKTATLPEAIAAALARAPTCQRVVLETGRMAPMLYHGLEVLGVPVRLHREPTSLSGAEVAGDAQDRSQRCARAGASGPHRVLQARPCEVAASACRPRTDHRAQEAGRPAGHAREPDPWSGRRVRRPAAARAQPGLREAGRRQRKGSPACPAQCADCSRRATPC